MSLSDKIMIFQTLTDEGLKHGFSWYHPDDVRESVRKIKEKLVNLIIGSGAIIPVTYENAIKIIDEEMGDKLK